ncbi:unnamed protein product [Hermetia illucens]|uniref:Bestrophin homolog n=1 Tax=Hermetia illucens TaxID=343691 RepID=A0A7R8UM84_HERIL|nr:bestrophin-2 isoform X2 [Hermetia illucens]CAD7083458.1 unnamed protein product [Hermetia illucens]
MTITYSSEVPNGSSFGCFWRILRKWRGSVYKLVWRELVAYLGLYYTINLIYRFALNRQQQIIFEKIRQYCGSQIDSIPMSFVLGFYVSLVVKRWWEQYKLLPWPDTLALFISAAIPDSVTTTNDIGRLMRRNIMRYMVLAYVITLQRISLRVKRRFPTAQHLVDAGLMMESERKIFDMMNSKSPMSKYWMPLVWATNIINRARKDGHITSDHIVQTLLMELSDIRRRLGALIGYDTVCVPLVYTQVVTLVLNIYFIATLMGKQMIPTDDPKDPDLYFPVYLALQFCFYVGWLKVAEVLINPFGEDDDDIELNWLIDRHIKAAYMIVDEMHEEHPELLKDQYWEEVVPKDLPYTVASEHYRRTEPKGSAENYKIKKEDAMYANITPSKRNMSEDVYADYESVDTPMVERRKNWFSRQITRMGSVRSSSTAYSSGGAGLFNRNRVNSVYSSPEAGLPLNQNHQPHKMSLYDKFVGRRSTRRQFMKQNSKLNLNGNMMQAPLKNRPRIPTPDVTKEGIEKERFNITTLGSMAPVTTGTGGSGTTVASGVALMAQQLATTPAMYPSSNENVPVLGTLLLSPIKEMDSNSAHNTLQAGHPTTAALAQAVLPKTGFGSVGITTTSAPTISTLSFPFAVTTTSDTVPALSIVSVVPTTSASPIITSNSDNLSLSPIPLSLAIAKTNSTASITEIVDDPKENLLTADSDGSEKKISLSRKSSLNIPSSQDSYILERKYSDRSKSHDTPDSAGSLKLQPSLDNSTSAPSTLTKRKPEPKTGEVYV